MKLTRRNTLVGLAALAGGALAPGLSRRAEGGDPAPRKRFVVWYTPNGTWESAFRPTGGETTFVLPEILAPLERHRDQLLLLGPAAADRFELGALGRRGDAAAERGISIVVEPGVRSEGHGNLKHLTGWAPQLIDGLAHPGGISLDQRIVQARTNNDLISSLELGIRMEGTLDSYLAWESIAQRREIESDPLAAYERVFATGRTDDPRSVARDARRAAVLKFAQSQVGAMRERVPATDRDRLDRRAAGIVALQQRLGRSASCVPPPPLPEDDAYYREDFQHFERMPLAAAAQLATMAAALACGITHVGLLQFTWSAAFGSHPWLGISDSHHQLSHDAIAGGVAAPEAVAKLVAINRWYMEQLAHFLDLLAGYPEVDGSSVLDHTTVLVINELSVGAYHTHQNMPWFLAGNSKARGGTLRTGRYVTLANRTHQDLLLSCLHSQGIFDDSFGDRRFCTGPIQELF